MTVATVVYWDEVEDEIRPVEVEVRRGDGPSRLLRRAERETALSVSEPPCSGVSVDDRGGVHVLSGTFLDPFDVERSVRIAYCPGDLPRAMSAVEADAVEADAAELRLWP